MSYSNDINDRMLSDSFLLLMAQIMQEGMTGYRIAALFNDANQRKRFMEDSDYEFVSPGELKIKKENYVRYWLKKLNEHGWREVIVYIAKELVHSSRAYFAQDESHPYPKEKIEILKKELEKINEISYEETTNQPIKPKKKSHQRIHGKRLKNLLSVILDKDLALLIEKDIREIENCIINKAYKSAVILCGSILEAILTDWLHEINKDRIKEAFKNKFPNKKLKKIEDLGLIQLIGLCEELELIQVTHSKISDAVRNYRNLIHPSVAKRKKYKITKNIAEIGLNLVFEILELRRN